MSVVISYVKVKLTEIIKKREKNYGTGSNTSTTYTNSVDLHITYIIKQITEPVSRRGNSSDPLIPETGPFIFRGKTVLDSEGQQHCLFWTCTQFYLLVGELGETPQIS